MGAGPDARASLRELPAVHELAAELASPEHILAVRAARTAIEEHRRRLLDGEDPGRDRLSERARRLLEELQRPSLRRVVNATGVILHTNLGRAPLPRSARAALGQIADGYSNLELDLERGARGSRHAHVEELLCELTGAESAIAVNNGAAALLLAVAALAGDGSPLVISRGQLVEIGGGFRIPDVIARSGARVVEVGTTNRTRLRDYQRAMAAPGEGEAGIVLRVHQSNFRSVGFVEDVDIADLCGLGVPVIDDIGSGVIGGADAMAVLADEPTAARSVAAGAALVCFSGDKLLGGPQAGLIVGRRAAVERARAHALARALRIDKLSLAALEATLMLYRDPELALQEIPVLAMLAADEAELACRAQRLAEGIGDRSAQVIRSTARVGGGALPLAELDGPAVALSGHLDADAVAAALRGAEPPVIARIHDGRLLLDPRTVRDDELDHVVAAVRAAAHL